ncbi:hypothetical protein BSTP3_178 [Bacillus phage BSTP3]|nr:hypothetical protein BSTP3_178 [Bacillus phage BSTP3]
MTFCKKVLPFSFIHCIIYIRHTGGYRLWQRRKEKFREQETYRL